MTDRALIVAEARKLLDTPFQHQARLPGIAIDCAGVVICVARARGMVAPDMDVNGYDRAPDGRMMLCWCRQYMREIRQSELQPGDVVSVIVDRAPQHLGIVGDYRKGLSIIHAALHPGRVIETRLIFSSSMRFAAGFVMPGVA